ncbi:MAG: hypothetical protein IKX20_08480 [Paludibacteraceae bacterium]|nr:hypothetical protein [Paludibacteraceae bacterium]
MKYYTALTDEEIRSICLCFPYKELITGFKKYPKDFSALMSGRRPQSVGEEVGRNLIANNLHSNLTAKMVEVLLSSWVPKIPALVKEQLEDGREIDYAYIIAFSKLGGPSFVRPFFRFSDEGFSEERISAICAGVAALSAEREQIKELHNSAATTKQVEDLKRMHKAELKEKEKKIKRQDGTIKVISKELEKERKTASSLREENKQIDNLQKQLFEAASKIDKLRQDLQAEDIRVKKMQEQQAESEARKQELEKENAAILATLDYCKSLLDQIEQQKQATMALVYGDTADVLCPVDRDEFREYLSYNFSSIGIDPTMPFFSLLLGFLDNTVFNNKPIICNQALGHTLARCISNTLCGSQNPTIVPYRKEITTGDIQAILDSDDRIVLFDAFIGNYNEMELLPILRSAKRKIIIITAEFDKTIALLLPEEVLVSCTYINANNIPELLTLKGLDEDPSSIKEELCLPLYKEPNSRVQRLCKEIMSELGFPTVVSATLSEQMTSEEMLNEFLAFSIIPYSIEAYGISPYNASARLNKYAGFSGKCAHKGLLMEWYGDV